MGYTRPAPGLPPSPAGYTGTRETLYTPLGDGTYARTVSLRQAEDGRSLLLLSASPIGDVLYMALEVGGERMLQGVDSGGHVRFFQRLPQVERSWQMAVDAAHQVIYASCDDTVSAWDATTGASRGQVDLQDGSTGHRLTVRPAGGVLVEASRGPSGTREAGFQGVITLDENLVEVARKPLDFDPWETRFLADGSALVWNEDFGHGQVVHLDRDGRTELFRQGNLDHVASAFADDGSLLYVVRRSRPLLGDAHVAHRYDPRTRRDERLSSAPRIQLVEPLPRGRFLTLSGREEPAVEVRDARGHLCRSYQPGKGEWLDCLLVSEDGRTAWMSATRSQAGNQHVLYRLSLEGGPSHAPLLPCLSSPCGPSTDPLDVVYASPSEFQPGVTLDGQVVVCDRRGVTLLDGDGRVKTHLPDLDALERLLGEDAVMGAHQLENHATGQHAIPARFEAWKKRAAAVSGLPWHAPCPAAVGASIPPRPEQRWDLQDSVSALVFPGRVEAARALAECGLGEAGDEGTAVASRVAGAIQEAILERRSSADLDFHDGTRARLDVHPHGAVLIGVDGRPCARLQLAAGTSVTSALPLLGSQGPYAAVGSSDGRVYFMQQGDAGPSWLALPESVQLLALLDDRRLLASDGSGMLVMEPELRAGERLHVPRPPEAARPDREEDASRDATIRQEDGQVIIGGIGVPRRKG